MLRVVQEAPAETTRSTILFVDDESRVLTSMRAMFRRQYRVLTADSGAKALALLASEQVDVVVSDQRMPEMTGVQMLARIKQLAPRVMRILLTGYADLDAIEASINEGEVFRYLMKPCPPAQLREAVELAIKAACADPVPILVEADKKPALQRQAANSGSFERPCDDSEPEEEQITILPADPDDPEAETPAPDSAPAPVSDSPPGNAHDVSILVLSADSELVSVVKGSAPKHDVLVADTLAAAVDEVERSPVGVFVTDMALDEEEVSALTMHLKEAVPELVTIIVAERSDANLLIDLINHGQVFRFLLKPVPAAQCGIWLASAAHKYLELTSDHAMRMRHQVSASESVGKTLVTGMLNRVKQLTIRFRRRSAQS